MVKIVKVDIEAGKFDIKDVDIGTGDYKKITAEIGCQYFEFVPLSPKYGAFVDEEPFRMKKSATVFGVRLRGCLLVFIRDDSSSGEEKYLDATEEDLAAVVAKTIFL